MSIENSKKTKIQFFAGALVIFMVITVIMSSIVLFTGGPVNAASEETSISEFLFRKTAIAIIMKIIAIATVDTMIINVEDIALASPSPTLISSTLTKTLTSDKT